MPDIPETAGPHPGLAAALAERYTIERELGRGGMAVVYLAQDVKHDRKVALKVLQPDVAEGVKTERFLREIQIAARLTHTNILPCYDSGEIAGVFYYVMPYVEGESLRDRISRETRLSLDATVQIIHEVAEALSYAHGEGVVHRDIKPENILLLRGHAVVMDFGIARALTATLGAGVTQAGAMVGTPLYMSPEQGSGMAIDGRSDVYSLGCVAYEMLAGRPPFVGQSTQELLARHSLDPVPTLRAARAAVPEHIERAIHRALAKQPEDRFASASEFARALTTEAVAVRRVGRRLAALATGAVVVAGVLVFAAHRATHPQSERVHDAVWARAVAIPQVQRLADQANWDSAWSVARAAAKLIPNDSILGTVWPQIGGRVTIETDPPEAKVYRSPYAGDSAGDYLGTTPLTDTWLPRLISRLRFEKDGYETSEDAFMFGGVYTVGAVPQESRRIRIKLFHRGELPSGMIYVPGGSYQLNIVGIEHVPPVELRDYFIDRYEVTNREYKQFVAAGGYRNRKYWHEPFVKEGHAVSWSRGVGTFVDRTGRPGPTTWEAGDYLEGQDEYPVGGLSWYEAAAYARFAGKSLPSVYDWGRAAGSAAASWVVPRSNFAGQGPARVGAHAGMSQFGAYDMAGNVREWCLNRSEDQHYILGGGWNDATYLFNFAAAESPWDRSPTNGVRLVSYSDKRDPGVAAQPILLPRRDFYTEQPPSDQAFAIYRRVFEYDRTPLDATVDETDSTDARWIKQRVSFRAAYGNERVLAMLFLPRGFKPPYQAVVFFPGATALFNRSSKTAPPVFDFVVKSGRALIYPIYQSTYERGDDLNSIIENQSNAYKEHIIMWAKDLRRAVDYAETRSDLDVRRLAYFGVSWGAAVAPILIVAEPRIKVAVLNLAGLRAQRAQPEAEPFTYMSRVKIPVLLLSGRYDPLFPLDKSALPFFRLLGTAPAHKRHVISDGGHFASRPVLVRETLDWLDHYLGPVQR